jgi:hypothetical protein
MSIAHPHAALNHVDMKRSLADDSGPVAITTGCHKDDGYHCENE